MKANVIYKHVASFTDAWIETLYSGQSYMLQIVASFTDAWIETIETMLFATLHIVASFTDAWIETRLIGEKTMKA